MINRPTSAAGFAVLLAALALLPTAAPEAAVRLRGRTLSAADALPAATLAAAPAGPGFYIVAARDRVTRALRESLEDSGAAIVAYLPDQAFAVWADGPALARAAALEGVAFVTRLEPRDRIVPELSLLPKDQAVVLEILVAPQVPAANLASDLGALGLEVLGAGDGRLFNRVTARLPAGRCDLLNAAASIDAVFSIAPRPHLKLLNDTSIWVGQSGLDGGQATPVFAAGIHGEGQVVGIIDTGLDYDMCYFRDPAGPPPTNVAGATASDPTRRKVVAYDFLYAGDDPANNRAYDNHGHGTHVAGSVAGDNLTNLIVHDPGDGMAPAAKLVIQDGGYTTGDDCSDLPGLGCPQIDMTPIFQQAYTQGARLHSNSYGDRENYFPHNTYTAACLDSDDFMWTHSDFLLVYAAGNDGGTGNGSVDSPGVAKNTVAAGATNRGSSADVLAGFSSLGWAADGRTKPTVTCPGVSIISAGNDLDVTTNNCGTAGMSGTSMASPTCAGLGALARQYYTDGFYPSGKATAADAFTPSAALVKATLINSARPMAQEPKPISREQGYGRVTLADTLIFQGGTRDLFVKDEARAFATGATAALSYNVEVLSASIPLKVTLVWTDPASNPLAATNLVNDLDLVVSGPSGTFLGNVLQNGVSTAGGSPDRINVEEQVLLATPQPGLYTFTVQPAAIPEGPQGFALVATGDFPSPAAVSYLAYRVVATTDGDLDPEPGETVRLAITLKDPADFTATTISATLSTQASGVLVTDAYAAWNDLAAGQTGESLPDHYEIVLSPKLACGAAVPFKLAMTTAGSAFTGSFNMVLGAMTTIETQNFDATPLDNLPAGFTLSSTRPSKMRGGADATIENTGTSPGPASQPNAVYIGKVDEAFPIATKTRLYHGYDLSGRQGSPAVVGFRYWAYDLDTRGSGSLDQLVVTVSDNGGGSFPWEILRTPANFDSASDAGNAWKTVSFDLATLPGIKYGPNVGVRIEASVDEAESKDAIYVDDLTLTAPGCTSAGCSEVKADASATSVSAVCPNSPVLLDGTLSTALTPCPAGLVYSWWAGGQMVAQGATATVYPVAPTTYELLVTCGSSGTCKGLDEVTIPTLTPSAPKIDANSLRAVKLADSARLSWTSPGPDRYNVHETASAADLPTLYVTNALNPAPLAAPSYDAPASAASVRLFQAYGASDCDGRSLP